MLAWVVVGAVTALPSFSPPAPSPVRAQGSMVLWSAYDERRDRFRLILRRGDTVRTLPVRPQRVPFDADLGTDTRGRPQLVYSRCRHVSRAPVPEDRVRRGCELRVMRLSGRLEERPVRNAIGDGEEVAPTLWHGRVAWARRREGAPEDVLTRPLTARRGVATEVRGALLPAREVWVETLELRGPRLAAISVGDGPDGVGFGQNTLRLVTLGGARRTIEQVVIGIGGQTLLGPSFAAGRLHWYLACPADPSGCTAVGGPRRASPAGGGYTFAKDSRALTGFAVRPAGSVVLQGTGSRRGCLPPDCTVALAPRPTYSSRG